MYAYHALQHALGSTYNNFVQQLSADDLPEVLKLQDIVFENLPTHKKNLLLPKSPEQFLERMTKLGVVHGVYDQHELIAYGALALPSPQWPVADMVIEQKQLPCNSCDLGVLQSSVVHPEHRNKGLHTLMVLARVEVCTSLGRPITMAEIAASNPASLAGFLKCGFEVTMAGVDPEDDCKLLFVQKKAGLFSKTSGESISLNPVKDFDMLQELLSLGYNGKSIKKVSKEEYLLTLGLT